MATGSFSILILASSKPAGSEARIGGGSSAIETLKAGRWPILDQDVEQLRTCQARLDGDDNVGTPRLLLAPAGFLALLPRESHLLSRVQRCQDGRH
jgi:hypothetical protein